MKLFHRLVRSKKNVLLIFFLFFAIAAIFFYQSILKGYMPFPGDLLVGHYEPYASYSFLGFPPGGVPNKAQGPDVIKELFPWKYFAIQSLKHLEIPFWDPYNFSGNPLLSNFQSAVFYPINIIFFILPFNLAWTLYIFLTPVLAGFFMYLFLNELGRSKVAGVFAGIVFAFSSYMVVWMEYGNIGHTFLWLPLALLFTEKLIKKFTFKRVAALSVVLFLSFLGGYIQGYFYINIIVLCYFLFKRGFAINLKDKTILVFLFGLSIPVFLGLFQLLPTYQLFTLASRGNYSLSDIQKLLNPFWYLITIIAPDFFGNPARANNWFSGTYIERVSYIGVIPLILAIAGAFSFRKNREVKIFALLGIFSLFITTDLFITKYFYLLPIPMISTTVPTRMLSIFISCASVLSAFGLDNLLAKKNKKNLILSIISGAILLVFGWIFVFSAPHIFAGKDWITNLPVARRNLGIPSLLLALFAIASFLYYVKRIPEKLIVIALFLITLFDLFRFFNRITPFSPQAFVYPQTPVVNFISSHASIDRFWGYGSGYIESNFQTYDQTYSPEGNDPLHIRLYTEFLEGSKNGQRESALPRPDANIVPGFGENSFENNYFRQKVLNILGVKYMLRKDEALSPQDKNYILAWQEGSWKIYENLSAVARPFLTNNYVVVKNHNQAFNKFFEKDFNETKTLILQKNPAIAVGDKEAKPTAVSYKPNEVLLKTSADFDGVLFLSDNFYPGWKAKIDGKETDVFLADYTFRAVVVPKGQHTVEFFYQADFFQKGLVLSGISLLLFAILFIKFKDYEIT